MEAENDEGASGQANPDLSADCFGTKGGGNAPLPESNAMTEQRIDEIAKKWAKDWKEPWRHSAEQDIKSAILEAIAEPRKELSVANELLDQHAHEFKQLRDALEVSGSDLPQLLDAIEKLRKDSDQAKIKELEWAWAVADKHAGEHRANRRILAEISNRLDRLREESAIDAAMKEGQQ